MHAIVISNPHVGSIEWELPREIGAVIATLPEADRRLINTQLEAIVMGHLMLIMAALKSGDQMSATLKEIVTANMGLAHKLKAVFER